MPTYVYACPERDHPRVEVTHLMKDNPVVTCKVCSKRMARVPQPFRLGFNAQEILIDWLDNNFGIYKATGDRSKLFSPDLVKRPGKPIPGKQTNQRKVKAK